MQITYKDDTLWIEFPKEELSDIDDQVMQGLSLIAAMELNDEETEKLMDSFMKSMGFDKVGEGEGKGVGESESGGSIYSDKK